MVGSILAAEAAYFASFTFVAGFYLARLHQIRDEVCRDAPRVVRAFRQGGPTTRKEAVDEAAYLIDLARYRSGTRPILVLVTDVLGWVALQAPVLWLWAGVIDDGYDVVLNPAQADLPSTALSLLTLWIFVVHTGAIWDLRRVSNTVRAKLEECRIPAIANEERSGVSAERPSDESSKGEDTSVEREPNPPDDV